jgi:hypothetical protein
LFVVAIAASQRGPVGKFLHAGAVSTETARRPSSLDIMYVDTVRSAVKRGILVATGDGRYYVDLHVYRRRQQRMKIVLVVATVVFLLLAILLFAPLHL